MRWALNSTLLLASSACCERDFAMLKQSTLGSAKGITCAPKCLDESRAGIPVGTTANVDRRLTAIID